MREGGPDPSGVMALATGYWNSAALLAANEVGLFGALAAGPKSAAEVAADSGADVRGVTLLLDACAGLGLLEKEEAAYRNAPEAQAFLVPGSPAYLGGAIAWGAGQWAAWGRLSEAVQSGRPAAPPSAHLGGDPEQTRAFVLGMHNRALGLARGVLNFLDLGGATELLDVGGGPGTYSVLLAQKYPGLRATVLDLPGVVAVADEIIAESNVGDQVQTRPGDARADDYGASEFDAVLFSGVLHQMDGATIQSMFSRARQALRPGGRVFLSDLMLNTDKTRPVFSALFSLQMLLTSDAGAVFSSQECAAWLAEVGFSDIHVTPLPPPLPYTVVTAKA